MLLFRLATNTSLKNSYGQTTSTAPFHGVHNCKNRKHPIYLQYTVYIYIYIRTYSNKTFPTTQLHRLFFLKERKNRHRDALQHVNFKVPPDLCTTKSFNVITITCVNGRPRHCDTMDTLKQTKRKYFPKALHSQKHSF